MAEGWLKKVETLMFFERFGLCNIFLVYILKLPLILNGSFLCLVAFFLRLLFCCCPRSSGEGVVEDRDDEEREERRESEAKDNR